MPRIGVPTFAARISRCKRLERTTSHVAAASATASGVVPGMQSTSSFSNSARSVFGFIGMPSTRAPDLRTAAINSPTPARSATCRCVEMQRPNTGGSRSCATGRAGARPSRARPSRARPSRMRIAVSAATPAPGKPVAASISALCGSRSHTPLQRGRMRAIRRARRARRRRSYQPTRPNARRSKRRFPCTLKNTGFSSSSMPTPQMNVGTPAPCAISRRSNAMCG